MNNLKDLHIRVILFNDFHKYEFTVREEEVQPKHFSYSKKEPLFGVYGYDDHDFIVEVSRHDTYESACSSLKYLKSVIAQAQELNSWQKVYKKVEELSNEQVLDLFGEYQSLDPDKLKQDFMLYLLYQRYVRRNSFESVLQAVEAFMTERKSQQAA